jgi:raffinose/stachyose/melibiose transport system permease protein
MKRYTAKTFLLEILMLAVAVAFCFPLYVVLMVAIKSPQELAVSSISPSFNLDFANFTYAWNNANMGQALFGSAFLSLCSVTLQLLVAAPAAYALARRHQRLSTSLYLLFLFGLMLPGQLGLLPLYQTVVNLHQLGTYQALMLIYIGGGMPFCIFLLTGFIRSVSIEYEYAALIDGASRLQTFVLVIFPLLRPILGTLLILGVVGTWNDFMTPLIYLQGSTLTTVPVAIYSFANQYSADYTHLFAATLIGVLPILAAFIILQRYFIQGFAGGIKG